MPAKEMETIKWLELGTVDASRPVLSAGRVVDGKAVAANGYVMHIVEDHPYADDAVLHFPKSCHVDASTEYPDIKAFISDSEDYDIQMVVRADLLWDVLRGVKLFDRDRPIRFSVPEEKLLISTANKKDLQFEYRLPLFYNDRGEALNASYNRRLVYNALQGMKHEEFVHLKFRIKELDWSDTPAVIMFMMIPNQRTAVIMSMAEEK